MPVVENCSKCGEKKDKVDKDGVGRCSQCRRERSKELRAKKRAEKGLHPIGSGGRSPLCYNCGKLKENPKIGYCHACKREQDNEWRLKTGRTIKHRTGKCACGNEFASYSRYQCVDCYRKYRQEKRQDPEYRDRTFKQNVRTFTRNCIKIGILIKEQCKICGTNENVEAHHEDYTKPLDVIWLCRNHHREHHKNQIRGEENAYSSNTK
jgi:hypothetical protein